MSAGNVLLGVVIGMATGATLGVLFAPDKGSATRKKLSKQSARYVKTLKDTTNEYVDTLESKFETAKESAAGFLTK